MDVPIVKLTLPDEILDKAREVLASGMWVDHDEVHALEQEFAEYCGVKYCRAVSNGTAALMTIAGALSLGPEDEVIVPSFTFIATANCVKFLGAKPVFADIDPANVYLGSRRCVRKNQFTYKSLFFLSIYLDYVPIWMRC